MKDYVIIPLQVYPYDVLVSKQKKSDFTKTLKEILPRNVHHEIDDPTHKYKGKAIIFSSNQSVIHFMEWDQGTIVHEAFHVVQFIMDRIKMPLTNSTSEAYAYLIEYLVNQINKWINE